MKTLVALCAGFVALGTGYHLDGVSDAPEVTTHRQAETPQSYSLHVPGRSAGCRVTKGQRVSTHAVEIELSAGCADAPVGLENATLWREEAAGDVVLVAADGRALARFAMGDGVAYESYRPRLPLMSLTVDR